MSATEALDINLSWMGNLQFQATNSHRVSIALDGDSSNGVSPMEALLAALSSCMAADVVAILQKMRLDLKSLTVVASGDRNPEPPRFFRRIHLTFSVRGDIPADRLEHAIKLSFERYCSVFHSLRQDIQMEHRVLVEP